MNKKISLTTNQITELKELIALNAGSGRELARFQAILMYEKGLSSEIIHELSGLKRSATLNMTSLV